jgi:membrane protein required for colicin V production
METTLSQINFSALNWFDITVFSVIFASTLFALLRGFIKGIFSLITWVCATSIAAVLYTHVHELVAGHVQSDKTAIAISSFGVFIIFFIIFALICSRFIRMLDGVRGGVVDRLLGLVFGFARGALIACLAFFSIDATSKMLHFGSDEKPGPSWFAEAQTYKSLQVATNSMVKVLPDDVPQKLMAEIDKFKDLSTTMMQGQGGDDSNGLPRTLNADERKMMKKVIAALPKDDLDGLYKKYEGGSSDLSEIERMAIFRQILTMYSDGVASAKIKGEKLVPESEIALLDKALNGSQENKSQEGVEENTGYKDMNIKQMDRLVGNVEQESHTDEKK